jgi:hypothetical protein
MTPECHRLAERLERARLLRRWSEVLAVAQQLMQMNPKHDAVSGKVDAEQNARSHGDRLPRLNWDANARDGFDVAGAPELLPHRAHHRTQTATWLQKWWSLAFPGAVRKANGMADDHQARRFLLWIDAVGGFLVCTSDHVVIGQPVPGSDADIPIRGDLSRRHAVIHRDREGYLLEPVRDVSINGKRVPRVTSLQDGDRLTLGDSVEMRFRRPHPLSLSARLEPISYHRTQPATDGVLLMAESCILGPAAANHIVCPRWPHDVVIYRQGAALGCRSPKSFTVDGATREGRTALAERAQVSGERFSFSIEPAE